MSVNLNKSKLVNLIMEEINNAIEDGTLINEGTLGDDILEFMLATNAINRRLDLIKKRGAQNPMIIADFLAKLHGALRPEGNIQDLFIKTKAAETAGRKETAKMTQKASPAADAAPEKAAAE